MAFEPLPTDVPVYDDCFKGPPAGREIRPRYQVRYAAESEVKRINNYPYTQHLEAKLVFVDDRTSVGHFHPWAVETNRVEVS